MNIAIQSLERVIKDIQAFTLRSSMELNQIRAEASAIPLDSEKTTKVNPPHLGQNIDRKC